MVLFQRTTGCLHRIGPAVVSNFNNSTKGILHVIAEVIYFFDGRSPEKGARTTLYLATSPEVENVSGKYFLNCKQIPSSRRSYDVAVQHHLWNVSEALIRQYAEA